MKPKKLPPAVITKYCKDHVGKYCICLKACFGRKESDQFGQQPMFLRIPKFFVCWLTLAFIRSYTCLSYVSYQNKQPHNISTRTTLNSSLCWLTLAFIRSYTCLSYVSYQNKQPHNISTRTTLNSSQLINRSITNGAKLINLPRESPLSGRSDKLVRDPFETKEPVYNF